MIISIDALRSLTAGAAGGTPPGFALWGTELEEEKDTRIPG